MHGDFTRFTHNPAKRFTRVLKQQGRVDLDADWNELVEIQAHLGRIQAGDVVGLCGAPKSGGGFHVTGVSSDGSDFTLSPGRIYVGGILCEGDEKSAASYLTQSDYPDPPALTPRDGRTDLVYLEVWERHVTAIEDPDIRETALGGPDTTTRTRTVCQVKVLTAGDGQVACTDVIEGWPPLSGDGRLTVGASEPPAEKDPCILTPNGGYRGLENRLYRVEIHSGSGSGVPTFKWSRDNGSVVFGVEEFMVGEPHKVRVKRLGRDQVLALRTGDWVEVQDDAAELMNRPGTLARITSMDEAQRILTLSKPFPGYTANGHAKVRRWDQKSDAIPVSAGPISLEDGIEIAFSGTGFKTGDYWTFAARTATADVEALDDAPPQGIRRHYCPLALIVWKEAGEGKWQTDIKDCRPQFPPLTEICAEDVCFDNSSCGLADAETVQDALERLCGANDLRHHNKHLHGWGIVCGLQVVCNLDKPGAKRRHVTVREGYAIDCQGNDLLLGEEREVDVLDGIARLDKETPDDPILKDGSGEVCLTLELDGQRRIRIGMERYDPMENSLASLLNGSLLMDFYNGCIKTVTDFVRKEFTPQPGEEEKPVSATQKRIIAFTKLTAHLFSPAYGRYVFLSQREDGILRKFYEGLRKLLQSETFCAMFDNARDFPDYPFGKHGISTIFGKGFHTRLKISPAGEIGYTVGMGRSICVYHLGKEELVTELEVPGGDGLLVRDVAFSKDGRRLYAVATLDDESTVFAVADVDGLKHTWRPVAVFCGIQVVALAAAPSISEKVYAIGRGKGLYAIDVKKEPFELELLHQFNAVGHLVLAEKEGIACASARTAATSDLYDSIVIFDLRGRRQQLRFELRDPSGERQLLTGRDDIAVVSEQGQTWLFAVADSPAGMKNKRLFRFNAHNVQERPSLVDLNDETGICLGHIEGSPYLLLGFEDRFRLRILHMAESRLVDDYIFPVQISPLAIGHHSKGDRVYVLNALSNTITTIPAGYFKPLRGSDIRPAPGSQEFLKELEAYRVGVLNAFVDLVGGLLQYLKDCLCHHFLINCPECGRNDRLYLACVSVRDGEVHKVCNFSRRKYVKSFPAIGYWLSLIPVMPLIDKAVETFCCTLLPDLFRRFTAPAADAYAAPLKGFQMRESLAYMRSPGFRGIFRERIDRLSATGRLAADWVGSAFVRPAVAVDKGLSQSEIMGHRVDEVLARLEKGEVVLNKVEPYNSAQGSRNLLRFTQTPLRVPAGSRINLYEKDGIVRYYALAEEPPESLQSARAEMEAQKAALTEVETLKKALVQMQDLLQGKDEELRSLHGQVQMLEKRQTGLEVEASPAKVAELEKEVKELRRFREEVARFMERSGPSGPG